MRRSVQVGIAILVLSVRLWNKLFFVSDFMGKYLGIKDLSMETISYGVAIFFALYYCTVKVLQPMIFRARIQ